MNLDIPYPKIELDDSQLERLFTVVPALIVVLAGVGALWLYFSVISLLPEAETVVNIPELRSKASVTRDANGVPTIMAESEEDAALLLGYVMAQDRLWQMDYLRRAGDGRLANIFGKAYLPRDEVARVVRRSPGLVEELSHLDHPQSLWLDRFVQGINRFIANHKGKYPVEFSVLDYEPQSFSMGDVNSIICAVAWDSSMAVGLDPLMNRIAGKLGINAINELLPFNSVAPKPVIPSELRGWEPKGLLFEKMGGGSQQCPINGFQGGLGWAVRPERSKAGSAMLCNVVYQELSAPPFWYRARISAGNLRLAGAFIPGVPVAISGANHLMSWGGVHIPIDDADLYIEQIDSEEECRYFRADGWRKCEKLEEKFTVRGSSTKTRPLLRTEAGPIVSDIERGHAMAMRWAGLGGTGLFQCMYQINRATKGSDLLRAALGLVAPALEIVWADSAGNIGSQVAGKIPVRPAVSDGTIALPAWTGVHGWFGFVPPQDLPSTSNPREGYVVAGESTFARLFYPFPVGPREHVAARKTRLASLIEEKGAFDRETLARISLDTYSPWAAKIVPTIVNELEQVNDRSELESKALSVLKEWDFMMDKDSAAAALFSLWYDSLLDNLLRGTLGNGFYREIAGHSQLLALVAEKKLVRIAQSESQNVSRGQLMRKSFRMAVSMGRKLLGDEAAKWRWGNLHKAEFQHPLAAQSSFLGALFDVGPIAVDGSWDTIKFSNWSPTGSFRATGGCSLTQLGDMLSMPVLLSSVPLGNSAHFFSSHYKNGVSAWQTGRLSFYTVAPHESVSAFQNTVLFEPSAGTLPMRQ